MAERNYLVRADGEWVCDSLGRLVKFTEAGGHRWATRKRPGSYSVLLHARVDRTIRHAEESCACGWRPTIGDSDLARHNRLEHGADRAETQRHEEESNG